MRFGTPSRDLKLTQANGQPVPTTDEEVARFAAAKKAWRRIHSTVEAALRPSAASTVDQCLDFPATASPAEA